MSKAAQPPLDNVSLIKRLPEDQKTSRRTRSKMEKERPMKKDTFFTVVRLLRVKTLFPFYNLLFNL